ncbi:response regulator transcription factor [Aquimarina sp. 2304DJ70-9]|uniref:response regulator transcription factor n=1 Tax=Aquimarina penaris TaxID=3231044 RepID=UPI003463325B
MEEHIEVEVIELFPGILLLSFTVITIIGIFLYFKNRRNHVSQESCDPYLQKLALLSSRERQVLGEILKYKSLKEIGETLFIEVSTVKSHANRIYKLFGVKNKKELQISLQQYNLSSIHNN